MNITKLKIFNVCLLLVLIFGITFIEYFRIRNLQKAQNAELKEYIDANWHMLRNGEWIVDYHNGTADRYTEYGSVWTELASTMGEKGLSVASIDVATNPELRQHLHTKKFPVVFHVVKGIYHVCPEFNDLTAMKYFVEHKNWPLYASIKHAIYEFKAEVKVADLWLKYTYVSGCYLVLNILMALYRFQRDIIDCFKFLLLRKSNSSETEIADVKLLNEKLTDVDSETSICTVKGTEAEIPYVTLPNEIYTDEPRTMIPQLMLPEIKISKTRLTSPKPTVTSLLETSTDSETEEAFDDAVNICAQDNSFNDYLD